MYRIALLSLILSHSLLSVVCDSLDDSDITNLPFPRYSPNGTLEWGPRIIGGVEATLGEFRGKISVQLKVGITGRHFCGGTLVETSHVVTAAHCLYDSNKKKHRPGDILVMGDDLSVGSPSASRQIRTVKSIFVHPKYNSKTLENDIGLLRLQNPFDITGSFNPVNWARSTPPTGTNCSVAGWGTTMFPIVQPSLTLMRIDIPIIDMGVCNRSYGMLRPGMMCAGLMEGGKDSCQGDSGGGLMCNNILTGVVSFGTDCAKPNYPGVYTEVQHYANWVNHTIYHGDASTVFMSFKLLALAYLVTKLL